MHNSWLELSSTLYSRKNCQYCGTFAQSKNYEVTTAGHYLAAAINNRGIMFSVRSVLILAHTTMECFIPPLSNSSTAKEEWCFLHGPCLPSLPTKGQQGLFQLGIEESLRRQLLSAWGYNRATLFLGDINTGTWSSRLGESQVWDRKMWSWALRDSDLRMTALAKTAAIVIDRPVLSSERAPHINKPAVVWQ
jgi:hypothetical protein